MADSISKDGVAPGLGALALKYGRMAKFRGHDRMAKPLLHLATWLSPTLVYAQREVAKLRPRPVDGVPHLHDVILGTSGTCNASCIHCPTGKISTAHVPRGTMPMEIFRKVIDGIVEEGVAVTDQISFGLFGDGLIDPLVIERARYVREKLPDVLLSINTNGAAFNPTKHAALNDYATLIALHCESIDPKTFDTLMTPLRAKNVFPKYEAVLRAYPGKVRVSVPVSRMNLAELPQIRAWFMERGAREVIFDPMSSRCVDDRTLFDSLALAPVRIRCTPAVLINLVVDCDGLVLSCCHDFAREEPIGDLKHESFRETMLGLGRAAFAGKLQREEHDDIATCNRCYSDLRTPDFPFDNPAIAREAVTTA